MSLVFIVGGLTLLITIWLLSKWRLDQYAARIADLEAQLAAASPWQGGQAAVREEEG
jgi:hypothetical protein